MRKIIIELEVEDESVVAMDAVENFLDNGDLQEYVNDWLHMEGEKHMCEVKSATHREVVEESPEVMEAAKRLSTALQNVAESARDDINANVYADNPTGYLIDAHHVTDLRKHLTEWKDATEAFLKAATS